MAAQFRAMKSPAEGEPSWTSLATTSLPVPLSPWTRTFTSACPESLSTMSRIEATAGQSPTRLTEEAPESREIRRFRRIDSDALATRFFRASSGNGLSRKS